MKLVNHSYGKTRVRALKVFRRGRRRSIKELEIAVMLQGEFESSYTDADNALVVPTDTMKNTVNALAHRLLGEESEPFGAAVAEHFLKKYRQVQQATVHIAERRWERMTVGGKPHPHSFAEQGGGRPVAQVVATRNAVVVESGIEDLLVLKTTQSGFAGFPKDEFTTLAETDDRLLCTKINAMWTYAKQPAAYRRVNQKIMDAMLKVFATTYSPSVQASLYLMGGAALRAAPEISKVSLALPNKHCLLIDLSRFGISNKNELFVPTDEPHGQIEGTVAR